MKLKCCCINSQSPALKNTSSRSLVINLCKLYVTVENGIKLPLCNDLRSRQKSSCNSGKTPPEGDKLKAPRFLTSSESNPPQLSEIHVKWHIQYCWKAFLFHVAVGYTWKLTSVCPPSGPDQVWDTVCIVDNVLCWWGQPLLVLAAPPGGRSRLPGEFKGLVAVHLRVFQGWNLLT